MTYSKACQVLNVSNPANVKRNAELAAVRLSVMTISAPLRFKVACNVLIAAAK